MAISTGLERIGALKGAVVRNPTEEHRSSSALEAFFDLCFVVAVAQVSTGLHETLAQHRIGDALIAYLSMFFAVWWAWMNFTWFANAHDADDIPYRLLTFIQMGGALVMAIGVTDVFGHQNFKTVTIGYVIMRVAQVTQWVRVALAFESMRTRALRYAGGIAVVQVLWVIRIPMRGSGTVAFTVLLVVLEVVIPIWAERVATGNVTHLEHITDRYGLFTLIVLGEAVSAGTIGIQEASRSGVTAELVVVAIAGLMISFAAWWMYFGNPHRRGPDTIRRSFEWGYGHYLIFASIGAIGAGIHLAAQYITMQAANGPVPEAPASAESATVAAAVNDASGHITTRVASLAVAVPVAVFILANLLLALSAGSRRRSKLVPLAAGSAIVLVAGMTAGVVATLVVAAATIVTVVVLLIVVDVPAAVETKQRSAR